MLSGNTTPEQDKRFHAVADRFDQTTQRNVRRAVMRGDPPTDPDVRPLALLYLETLERVDREAKRWLGPLWVGLAVLQAALAIGEAALGNIWQAVT
jgi:hypothetical protein